MSCVCDWLGKYLCWAPGSGVERPTTVTNWNWDLLRARIFRDHSERRGNRPPSCPRQGSTNGPPSISYIIYVIMHSFVAQYCKAPPRENGKYSSEKVENLRQGIDEEVSWKVGNQRLSKGEPPRYWVGVRWENEKSNFPNLRHGQMAYLVGKDVQTSALLGGGEQANSRQGGEGNKQRSTVIGFEKA